MDKLICIGKNYLEHAKELGDAVPEAPLFFLKPPSSVLWIQDSQDLVDVILPRNRGSVHHECEIVLRLDSSGKFDAVTLGLDMTLRDSQAELKKKGHPWEVSKVFQHAAVVGPWISLASFSNYLSDEFTFSLDGVVKQKGKGSEMRHLPQRCLEAAEQLFPICTGDLLFSGTPAGVGPVHPGQIAELKWGNRLVYRVQFV